MVYNFALGWIENKKSDFSGDLMKLQNTKKKNDH